MNRQGKERQLDRLVDALADGSLPADEIRARLTAETTRKTTLQAERSKLDEVAQLASLDPAGLERTLQERVGDVTGLLHRNTVQRRQTLRKILADKIDLEPLGSGRHRGYRFRGVLAVDRLIGDEALETR